MILEWIQRRQDFKLQWLGPNKIFVDAATPMEEIEARIAVITGPRGLDGNNGPPGPRGERGEAAVYSESLPLILDGGNF